MNRQLVTDVANLSYNTPLGFRSGLPSQTDKTGLDKSAVPGILSLTFVSSIGVGPATYGSAANIAAQNIYQEIRRANSGAKVYDSPDLMITLIAFASAYNHYATMARAYAVAQQYSPYNYYYGKALVEAMGIDYSDIQGKLAQLRAYINLYAQSLKAFNVPNVFPYYTRQL